MAQTCTNRQYAIVGIIMLAILCFVLFIAFGAVDVMPERVRQSRIDASKELLLTNVVCFCFYFSSHALFTKKKNVLLKFS